jgi:DNA-binding PadR family transcriptional regulator
MKTIPVTEYVLLGILMAGPAHGYEIMQFLDTALGSTWHVGTSQLYSLFKRLEDEGLVISSLETQEDRPSKRVFSLSEAGKKSFLVWLNCTTENVRDLRVQFLAKLFFFQRLGLEGGDELINRQVEVMHKAKERLQHRYENGEDPYDRLVLDFKLSTVYAWLEWLDTKAKVFIRNIHDHGRPKK